MNAGDQDQDFEKLQRLLKLKRHEQPHPRYFNDFSSQVTARIRAGEPGTKHESDESDAPLWLQRLWNAFQAKPAASGVFATAVCGLVLAGIVTSDPQKNTANTPPEFLNAASGSAASALPAFPEQPNDIFASPATTLFANHTNPTAVTPVSLPSLFSAPGLSQQTLPASGMPISPGAK